MGNQTARLDDHLANVVANLQLIADLAYGDVALAVPDSHGSLRISADARPNTAFAPVAFTRVGTVLNDSDDPEAYAAWQSGEPVASRRQRTARGINYDTAAFPVGGTAPSAGVIVRNRSEQVTIAPGAMEVAFMQAAEELLVALRNGPVTDVRDGEPFSTERRAGDGVMRVDVTGVITYASPNAVTIMRHAGVAGQLTGLYASELPGGGFGISPVVGASGSAIAAETEVGERVLLYRSIALGDGVLVLVEDRTDARRREAELKVKDATIREVHHRVKNNLQTIASLLRIQARRSNSSATREALAEATERVASMAVVHDLLAAGDEEKVDFADAAKRIVNLVAHGMSGEDSHIEVRVVGETGNIDAHIATSLALALAELVHNAVEHGFRGPHGTVTVTMRREERELLLKVADDGVGLPQDFDPEQSTKLGLSIVRTVVQDDLHGAIAFSGTRGTTVTVRIPLAREM